MNTGNKAKATEYISVCRTTDGYMLIDKMQGTVLANLKVFNLADEQLNSKLKDAILHAYYEYGKALECYD